MDASGDEVFEAREKGIDVRLAVDMVLGAADNAYDVAVLCSGDTDLIPALQAVREQGKRCEVMAWRSRVAWSPRLKVDDGNVWCHWLDERDYQRVHDPADYTTPLSNPLTRDP